MTVPVDPGDFTNAPSLSTPVAAPYKADADLYDARFLVLYRYLDKTIVGVDASAVRDATITWPLIEAQPVWSTVALVGTTWTPANLSYYKDSIGIVRIKPEAFSGTANLADGTTIATLPAGNRPGILSYFPIEGNDPAFSLGSAGISIDTAGVIRVAGNGGVWPQLRPPKFTHIEFRAEN